MDYYYYKDGEKIGPVHICEIDRLAGRGDITPETILEMESGRQLPASDVIPPSTFGTNPSGIPLKTARRRVVFCSYVILFALVGMILCGVVMVLAGFHENNSLLNWTFAVFLVLTGIEIGVVCYAAANKLNKVPPEYKRSE